MAFNTIFRPSSDEQRWVDQMRKLSENKHRRPHHFITGVPNSLSTVKPEAYSPQLIGLGPYQHFRPELYEMERGKLFFAETVLWNHESLSIHDVVAKLERLEPTIREFYFKSLDFNGDTLAWIIAIDGLFLLAVFKHLAGYENPFEQCRLIQEDAIHRDIMMLENQIPKVLLEVISNIVNEDDGPGSFFSILVCVCAELSPLGLISKDKALASSYLPHEFEHLLHLMHCLIVQNERPKIVPYKELGLEELVEGAEEITTVASFMGIPGAERFGKLLGIIQRLLRLWKGSISINVETRNKTSPEPEEMIAGIPSVSKLCSAGVKFSSLGPWGVRDIKFDDKAGTLYLPLISLNANSEIVLRNLVAYEASSNTWSSSNFELAAYTDLMSRIIDTAEDARLLRQKGIVKGLLTDGEVADLFKGMSNSLGNRDRWSHNIPETMEEVSKYYNNTWKVKAHRFMKNYVYSFCKGIAVLSTITLVLHLSVQLFCDLHGCTNIYSVLLKEDHVAAYPT